MEWWAWVLVTVAVVALLMGGGVLFVRSRQRHADRMENDPGYRFDVERKALQKALNRAQREYKSAVAKVERALKEAEKDPVEATVSKVKLTPLSVLIGQTAYPLSVHSTFQLDVDGQVQALATHRLGVTRMAAGAMLGGPAGMAVGALAQKSTVTRDDSRDVYLTVRDTEWGEVVKLQPTDIEAAKKFVLAAEIAVNKIEKSAQEKVRRVSAAKESLASVRAETTAIEAAERALASHEERAPRTDLAG